MGYRTAPRMISGVSVVVLTYGYRAFVALCLNSLSRQVCRWPVEIIVVDNGSTPEDWAHIEADIERNGLDVKRIRLMTNIGFAAGMNTGLAEASHDVMIALNSDVFAGEYALDSLSARAMSVVAPSFFAMPVYDWIYPLTRESRSRTLQAHAVVLTSHAGVLPVAWDQARERALIGPPGPAVAFNRACWDRIVSEYGFFYDPAFFMYGEDVDLFLRASRAAIRLVRVPAEIDRDEVLWHAGGASGEAGTSRTAHREPLVMANIARAWWRNAVQHSGWLELPVVLAIQMVAQVLLIMACARRHGVRQSVEMFASAVGQPARPHRRPRTWKPFLLPRISMVGRYLLRWQRP